MRSGLELRSNFDGFFERFIAAGLLQILAHLVVDVALEGEQAGVAQAIAKNGRAASSQRNRNGTGDA